MICRDDQPDTPDWVSSPHCCSQAECWFCVQQRPTVPPNVVLGED